MRTTQPENRRRSGQARQPRADPQTPRVQETGPAGQNEKKKTAVRLEYFRYLNRMPFASGGGWAGDRASVVMFILGPTLGIWLKGLGRSNQIPRALLAVLSNMQGPAH